MGLLAVGLSVVSVRFPGSRGALEGVPSVVIRDGTVIDEVLGVQRISVGELLEALRKEGITDLTEVSWGIVEVDGTFSFLRRADDSGE